MNMRAVIFDLDGVLLNTEPLYFKATQKILNAYQKQHTYEHQINIMGKRPLEAIQHLIQMHELPMTVQEWEAAFHPIFEQIFSDTQLTPGAESLVSQLKSLNIPLAIASSTDKKAFGTKTAQHQHFFKHFQTIVLGDDPECLHGKPAPDIYLLAAKRLRIPPEQCLVFEDAPHGILSAHRAGMRVIAIRDPHFDSPLFNEADACFEHLSEVPLLQFI